MTLAMLQAIDRQLATSSTTTTRASISDPGGSRPSLDSGTPNLRPLQSLSDLYSLHLQLSSPLCLPPDDSPLLDNLYQPPSRQLRCRTPPWPPLDDGYLRRPHRRLPIFFAYTNVSIQAADIGFQCVTAILGNFESAVMYAYRPESFPGLIRGTGTGVGGLVASLASTFAGFTSMPIYGSAALWYLVGVFCLGLAFETAGHASV